MPCVIRENPRPVILALIRVCVSATPQSIIRGFMQVGRRLFISGRVQGVGFRFFAEERAMIEGVHGWVRNLPDGRVEVYLEGERQSVDRVEASMRRGPAGAQVESVRVEEEVPSGRATGFAIR